MVARSKKLKGPMEVKQSLQHFLIQLPLSRSKAVSGSPLATDLIAAGSREIAKRTLTLCRQREDESVAQFLRRLTPLIEATNQSLTETQRNEKVCEEFLDRLKPNMSFLIRLVGLTRAKSLDVVKAQAEELEALLLVNRGEEVSRLSQAVNVINNRPSQPQWSAGPSPGAAGNEPGSSGSNMRNFRPFSAPNVQRQPPSFGGARGGFRNWAQGRQEQFSQSIWSGDRQCQYCGRIGHLVYDCQERQADFEDDQGRAVGQEEWSDQQSAQPQMGWQNTPNSAEIPRALTTFLTDGVPARLGEETSGPLNLKKKEKREPDELKNKNNKEGVGVRKKKLCDAQSGRPDVAHGMTKALVTSEDGHRVYGTDGPVKEHR
uniref:CCHC-type domain-containing protein n=1 Tax=Globodera rostochiensis TaxID=31243 RepID=A0A914I158_GLORO